MATVGGIAVSTIDELEFMALRAEVEHWQTPGHDRVGAQELGKHDSAWGYRVRLFGTEEEVEAWHVALEALQGTTIEVVDGWGRTRTNLLCLKAEALGKRRASPTYQCVGTARVSGIVAH